MEVDDARVVAQGVWLYDGNVPCKVIIQKEHVWPAFDDPEDDPNTDDKVMPCVSVWHESPPGTGQFTASGGYYHTVDEAKAAILKIVSGIRWKT
jgi:hypothetical protein